jgi:hypothetical protein
MDLLKKRARPVDPPVAESEPTSTAETAAAAAAEAVEAGKGRPTPKRSDARAARGKSGAGSRAPASRKEARDRSRTERRTQSQSYRSAMLSGDIAKLPPRERAPERILARDVVDSRFNVGPMFLAVAALYFIGGLIRVDYVRAVVTVLMIAGILCVIVDSVFLAFLVTRRVHERYPDSTAKIRLYAAQRALLPRRWRLPRPRVERGAKIR